MEKSCDNCANQDLVQDGWREKMYKVSAFFSDGSHVLFENVTKTSFCENKIILYQNHSDSKYVMLSIFNLKYFRKINQ